MNESSLYFVQWCPTCGRALRTRVSLLGKKVACHHCRSEFVTSSAELSGGPQRPPLNVQRADQLLAYFESARGPSSYATKRSARLDRAVSVLGGTIAD